MRVEVVELLAHGEEDDAPDERAGDRRIECVGLFGEPIVSVPPLRMSADDRVVRAAATAAASAAMHVATSASDANRRSETFMAPSPWGFGWETGC